MAPDQLITVSIFGRCPPSYWYPLIYLRAEYIRIDLAVRIFISNIVFSLKEMANELVCVVVKMKGRRTSSFAANYTSGTPVFPFPLLLCKR